MKKSFSPGEMEAMKVVTRIAAAGVVNLIINIGRAIVDPDEPQHGKAAGEVTQALVDLGFDIVESINK